MANFIIDATLPPLEKKTDAELPGFVGPDRIVGRDINDINQKLLDTRSTIRTLMVSGVGSTSALDVTAPTYGAKGDGATDDYAAINSAMVAGRALGKPVVMPPGNYRISRPLRIKQASESLTGLGGTAAQTTLQAQGYYGPVLVAESDLPSNWDFTYTAPMVTSSTSGRAIQLRGDGTQPFINVKDCRYGNMRNLGAFTFQFFIQRTGANGGAIISSNCGLYKGDSARIPFRVGVNQFNNSIEAKCRIGTTDYVVSSAVSSLPVDATVRHVRVSYDGAKFGVAVNGVWVTTNATGTVDMRAYEDLTLFCEFSRPHSNNYVNFAPDAKVQSLYMTTNATTVGAGFTVPTSQHTADGQTVFIFNGEAANLDGPLIKSQQGGTPAWFLARTNQIAPFFARTSIGKLRIVSTWGTCIVLNGAIQSTLDDLVLEGWCGLEMDDAFLTKSENMSILYTGRFGVKQDAGSGVVHLDRFECFGGGSDNDPYQMSYFGAGSSLRMSNGYFSAPRWGMFVLGTSSQCSINLSFCNVTDEGAEGAQAIDSALYFEDVLAVSATGCTMEVKKFATQLVRTAGATRGVWMGSVFTANQAATKIFQTVGPTPAVTYTLIECNRWSADGGATEGQVPWGDNYGLILAGVKQ